MKFKVEIKAYRYMEVEADDYIDAEKKAKESFEKSGGSEGWDADFTAIDCDEEVDESLLYPED